MLFTYLASLVTPAMREHAIFSFQTRSMHEELAEHPALAILSKLQSLLVTSNSPSADPIAYYYSSS